MLVAAAGNDLHDIMKEAGIVTVLRDAANAIPYAPKSHTNHFLMYLKEYNYLQDDIYIF